MFAIIVSTVLFVAFVLFSFYAFGMPEIEAPGERIGDIVHVPSLWIFRKKLEKCLAEKDCSAFDIQKLMDQFLDEYYKPAEKYVRMYQEYKKHEKSLDGLPYVLFFDFLLWCFASVIILYYALETSLLLSILVPILLTTGIVSICYLIYIRKLKIKTREDMQLSYLKQEYEEGKWRYIDKDMDEKDVFNLFIVEKHSDYLACILKKTTPRYYVAKTVGVVGLILFSILLAYAKCYMPG